MLTEALFQRTDARGFQDIALRLTDEALSCDFGVFGSSQLSWIELPERGRLKTGYRTRSDQAE